MKAYPFIHKHPTTGNTRLEEGMDLRDYFAAACFKKIGMFPQTLNIDLDGNMTDKQQAEFDKYIKASAKLSYEMADAMLKAREVKND